MTVVGVDIGETSTYITVARQGGVETIVNDYTQRNTPTVVALGDKQRFVGVSAENQKNLYVQNTVSAFKNFLGRKYKDTYVQNEQSDIGAAIVELEGASVAFKIGEKVYRPEEILGMVFTKVIDIVKSSHNEEISCCVVSTPLHFTESQRAAIIDACHIAGVPLTQLMNDTSAMALAYAKSRAQEVSNLDEKRPQYMAFIDIGASGLQSTIVALSKEKVVTLASMSSIKTGGKFFDRALVNYLVGIIETKHKVNISKNRKAMNKLRVAVEKIKKQMSANSNKMPLVIESLVEDIDISLDLDRATFESLISKELDEIRQTLQSLLNSTTIKKEALHSVEITGGSSRVPAIKQIIQDVFGVAPSTGLNADEGIARGCGLLAATLSGKFKTKKFTIHEIVTNTVEAVYNSQGIQERLVICDEGDSVDSAKSLKLQVDLPFSLSLQYSDTVEFPNRALAFCKVESEAMNNKDIEIIFKMDQNGMMGVEKIKKTQEAAKRRRTSETSEQVESQEMMDSTPSQSYDNLPFSITQLSGLPGDVLSQCKNHEREMIKKDLEEIARQEAKNILEEQMYKYRAKIMEETDAVENEDTFNQIKSYFDQTENWLYEDGEEAPKETYEEIMKSLHEKVNVFMMWKEKFLQMKARKNERQIFMEQEEQRQAQGRGNQRQIPVVYEGTGPYEPREPTRAPFHPQQGWVRPPPSHDHGYTLPRQQEGPRNPQANTRQRRPEEQDDRFFNRTSFFNDPLFGW